MNIRERYLHWGQQTRGDCPSIDRLETYRVLDNTAQLQSPIADHLQRCPRCINRLIDLREIAVMESAEPAPEGLLARVRATTRASIEGASTRQPSRASPRAPKTSLWDSLRSWLHQPAVAGGVFALLVLTFALLLVNQPMGPLMDPDLLPRGANFDQERLRAAVPAVTDSGVYFRGSNARFFLLRGLESEAVERTPAWIDLAAFETVQQGAYVALITTTGAVLPATVVRTGRGAVQTDQLNYSGRLLALTPISAQGETPTGVGTAVLNSDGGLIAVIIGQADDGAFLAAPPPE